MTSRRKNDCDNIVRRRYEKLIKKKLFTSEKCDQKFLKTLAQNILFQLIILHNLQKKHMNKNESYF